MIRSVALLTAVILQVSCVQQNEPVHQSDPKAAPVEQLQARVENGDRAAAAVLSQHYLFAQEADIGERVLWLRRSAETGDEESMLSFAAFQVVHRECEEAASWFDRWWATKAGSESKSDHEDMEAYRRDVELCKTHRARSES